MRTHWPRNRPARTPRHHLFYNVVLMMSKMHATVASRSAGDIAKDAPSPESPQRYPLLSKTNVGLDSCLLRFSLPDAGRHLGTDPALPTCIKVTLPGGTDVYGTGVPTSTDDLSKSYSPVSHPGARGHFDLLVKAYPHRAGGGVGAYLCGLRPPDADENCEADARWNSITAAVKSPRIMHGDARVLGRWKHVGLVAGGTGIAPLYQIAKLLLEGDGEAEIRLLFVNRRREDILWKDELDRTAAAYPGRFRLTYALTAPPERGEEDGEEPFWETGRGSVVMARRALPPPSEVEGDTMILVCGKDGFVKTWAGPVGRAPPKQDGTKGPKIQGPLLGFLKEAGYGASEVFKY